MKPLSILYKQISNVSVWLRNCVSSHLLIPKYLIQHFRQKWASKKGQFWKIFLMFERNKNNYMSKKLNRDVVCARAKIKWASWWMSFKGITSGAMSRVWRLARRLVWLFIKLASGIGISARNRASQLNASKNLDDYEMIVLFVS